MKNRAKKEKIQRPSMPHILVIDDDPLFRALVTKTATERKIPVTVCASMQELSGMTSFNAFDVALVDYYLDNLKETLRGTDIAALTPSTPTILMSATNYSIDDNYAWPSSVRRFMNKKSGVNELLDAAIHLYENRFSAES